MEILLAFALCAAPLDVTVIAGQSNAVGSGHVDDLPPGFPLMQEDVLYCENTNYVVSSAWGALAPRPSGAGDPRWYGAELTYGFEAKPGAIIKIARNGTSLAVDWSPGSSIRQLFQDELNLALSELQVLGFQPTVTRFLWIQGSGDANSAERAYDYRYNLEE
ncbi:MAG: sialate O-acetylesterase, partial [Saprospiraceae bacterium]|nr:sialate O-acetylesterase [Saprospiraceae bacterium]